MRRYILDTNLYIEAARSKERAKEVASFTALALPDLYLHAVVAQELLAGALTAKGEREVERSVVRPFEKRNRLLVPSWRAWKRSGEMISELVERQEMSPGGFSNSFMNDVLIAASLRESGAVLVTRNINDFERLARVEDFTYAEPWPKISEE